MQISYDPGDKFCKPIAWLTVKCQRLRKILFAIAVCQRGHQFLRRSERDMPSVIFFDPSQRKIDGCRETRRRIKRTIFNERPSMIKTQFWEAPRDIAGDAPVGGDFTPVQ
jgi:hypothetical protein